MPIVYNPITDFLTKDTLPKEDPDKVILGADFSAEFDAISTAFLGAVTSLDPVFTGTVTFEDATGDNLTLSTNLGVTGAATLGTLDVTGNTTLTTLTSGNQTVNGTITATGAITSAGAELQTEADVLALISTAELGPVSTLGDLSNVDETGKVSGDFLAWDSVAGNWEPSTLDLSAYTDDITTTGTLTGGSVTATGTVTGSTVFGNSFVENYELETSTANIEGSRIDNAVILNGGATFAYTGGQTGFWINEDGTFFIAVNNGESIISRTLNTPWDMSTASNAKAYNVSTDLPGVNALRSCVMSPDGTKIIADQHGSTGTGWKQAHQWTLSTPFDITTASYDGSNGVPGNAYYCWNDDGTKLISGTVDSASYLITTTTIDVAYDLIGSTSRVNTTKNLSGDLTAGYIGGITFNHDGTVFIVEDNNGVHKYLLSTAYDMSTAVYDSTASATTFAPTNTVHDLRLTGTDSSKLAIMENSVGLTVFEVSVTTQDVTFDCSAASTFEYVMAGNGSVSFSNVPATGTAYAATIKIKQDASGSGFTLTWPTGTVWAAGTAPTLSTDANAEDVFVLMTHDGGTTWYGFTSGQAFA